jgi:hypothetical protein
MSQIYDLCIVADDVRLELDNKASIIGYYGRLPDARIQVARTDSDLQISVSVRLSWNSTRGALWRPAQCNRSSWQRIDGPERDS